MPTTPEIRDVRGLDREPPLVSVVVPCFNEEEVLARAHMRLSGALRGLPGCAHEIVYVDDGSADETWSILTAVREQDPHVRLVRFSRNFGHQAAVLAGLRAAVGDAVVTIDADLQDPPELIADMVASWRDGARIVTGRRPVRQGETVFKKATAFAFYRLLRAVADQPVAVDSGDFRLLDRSVVDLIAELPERRLFLRGLISWTGLPESEIEYVRDPRAAGETKYTLRKMAALSWQGLVSSSSLPLRLPVLVGAGALATSATAAVVAPGRGVAGTAGQIGVQALLLGVVGEYIRMVHQQVVARPPYVVREEAGTPGPVLADLPAQKSRTRELASVGS